MQTTQTGCISTQYTRTGCTGMQTIQTGCITLVCITHRQTH